MLRRRLTDARGIFSQRMRAQHGEHSRRRLGRHKEHGLALIRHINRVEAEQLARRLHLNPHRHAGLVNHYAHIRCLRNLIQCGGQSAARGIAHRMNRRAGHVEHLGNHPVQRRAIAPDLALELQALSHAHDRHAVVADGSRDDDRVAVFCSSRTDLSV